jgi:hypothetical protein
MISQSGSRVSVLLNRSILGLFGIVFLLMGGGTVLLAAIQEQLAPIGWFIAGLCAAVEASAGLRLLQSALTGRLPAWFGESLFHLSR